LMAINVPQGHHDVEMDLEGRGVVVAA
jgi:hypothetical protein